MLKYSGSCHLQQILSVISQSTEIGQLDQQLTAEDLGKGVVGLNYLLKQRESVNFTQVVVVKTLLWWLSSLSLMLFNIIEKSHKMIANDECNCSATNLWVKKKKTNGISVAMEKKLIYLCYSNCSSVGCLKMFAIPQLVSAPLNPIPTAEHFGRSHPQCICQPLWFYG